jgi:hypothetical protein
MLKRRGILSSESLALITDICGKAVHAVEQSHGELAGPDKKQLAMQLVGEILSQMKIHPPTSLVDAAIESAVLLMGAMLNASSTQTTYHYDALGSLVQVTAPTASPLSVSRTVTDSTGNTTNIVFDPGTQNPPADGPAPGAATAPAPDGPTPGTQPDHSAPDAPGGGGAA